MSKEQPVTTTSTQSVNNKQIRFRIRNRFFRALDYLTIYIFIIVVYGGAVISDYLLFMLLWSLLGSEIQAYPIVALGFNYARIGLALLFIASAVIHGIVSTYSQIRLDIKLSREGE